MIRTGAAVAVVGTLMAGCSGKDGNDTAPPVKAPTVASKTPAPPAHKAADGNNLKACADGTCEVYVKTGTRIPVKASVFGSSTLIVSKVSAAGVDYGGKSACCSVSATQQQAGKTVRLNKLTITTVTITAPTAILRLHPA
ncbi:hypothetical protein F1D05_07700 [Kribbella qitaiheensis]|uniref:Lipoprotein n=1 Tax=Kribbella qitaiheensis TaxID=1544730 RepID=A0A7G6WUZ7_9ACTN|nr:hypothetical protein [Kribbella qitaiheensis]QNE17812.1 hypothetical protein F1D05_07700 [Kribbella qitaiheensis]